MIRYTVMAVAYVLINCDLGQEESVIENLKHIDSVKEVQGTFGAYDILAKMEHAEKEKLREMIIWSIRKMEHIRSTLTLVGIEGQN
jgi:DNA-binding Lrp family transcriptional regulator